MSEFVHHADIVIAQAIFLLKSPVADTVFSIASFLFEPAAIGCLFVVIFALAHWKHQDRATAFYAAAVLASCGIAAALKQAFKRARPETADVEAFSAAFSPSFPSAHAMISIVLVGLAAVWAWHAAGSLKEKAVSHTARLAIAGGATLIVLTVGMSRVYIGAHWPTDVLGGWLFGAAFVWACATAMRRHSATRKPRRLRTS